MEKKFKVKGGVTIRGRKVPPVYPTPVAAVPEVAVLPLLQQPGILLKPIVEAGTRICTGQKIAEVNDYDSVPLHASISGMVERIEAYPHPVTGEMVSSVVIVSDGADERIAPEKIYSDYFRHTPAELLGAIRNAGVVGLGGEAFPTHIKLNKGKKDVDTLIINAVESDPFLSCDNALLQEQAKSVVDGIKIAMYILDISRAIVALPKSSAATVGLLKNVSFHEPNIFIAMVPDVYPQSDEKLLVKTLLGKTVYDGELPIDRGIVVLNAATAYAICRAVKNGEHLVSRIVSVGGSAMHKPRNLWVRNGTLVSAIASQIGLKSDERTAAVVGGIMRGTYHAVLDTPVIKSVRGIYFLDAKEAVAYENLGCIRCGYCAEVCPIGLLPGNISVEVEHGRMMRAQRFHPELCIDCGCCSYVCPSHRPIFRHLQAAKAEARKS